MMRITIAINNNVPIMDLSVRRIAPDDPEIGEECEYKVETIVGSAIGEFLCHVDYPFGDGLALSRHVLNELNPKKV
tara:strand:+ start:5995 stop:6222 length:228 start_codon:yes stop_codon:yes gene_type:complete